MRFSESMDATLTIGGHRAKIVAMMTSDNSDTMQSSSLSTLIGYITGPKAEQPVGVRVVEPPSGTRQKQRGNLYAVVDLNVDHPDHDVIADHLLTVIQRTYYSAKGSQSHVMVEAVKRSHQVLQEINQRYPGSALRAGVLCAALLNGRLVVVASGSAMALIRVNDQVQMFPSELSMEQNVNGDTPMQVFRQTLRREDAMFLGGSSWLGFVPIKTLAGIVAFVNGDNCADAADELYAHAGASSPPGLMIVLTDDPDIVRPRPAQPPPAPEKAKNGKSRFLGLPTSLSASPPAGSTRAKNSAPSGSDDSAAGDEDDESARASLGVPWDATDDSRLEPNAEIGRDFDAPGDDESADGEGNAWSVKISSAAAAGLFQTKRFLSRMLPDNNGEEVETDNADDASDAVDATIAEQIAVNDLDDESDDDIDATTIDDEANYTAKSASFLASQPGLDAVLTQVEEKASSKVDKPAPTSDKKGYEESDRFGKSKSPPPPFPEIEPFTAPAPASGTRARLLVLLALVILVLAPAVVAAIYWSEGENRRQQAEQLTDAAFASYGAAEEALNADDKAATRGLLVEAKDYLTEAITLEGSSPVRMVLAADIELMLQDVLQVQPLYSIVEPLITFSEEARPHRVLVADSSIYVMDSGEQVVLRYPYDPSSGQVTDERGQIVLQQDKVIEGVAVGTLADMAWLPLIPGIEDKPTLLILDRNNKLFSYDPRVEGARLFKLNGQDEWRSASQVQTYNGRIYVADEGTNQIYRYSPGSSAESPDEWFTKETLVNLAGTSAMQIDGDIWLLLSSGNVMRYRGGEQMAYALENSIGLAEEPVDMYVTTQDRDQIFLADAGEDRILVYDKDGSYEKQLRAAEGDPLRGLSGIFIDEISETMFILTKDALYSHPLL